VAPHHWQQLKEILGDALEREGEDRTTYVMQRCGTDTTLRHEVESYLKNSGQTVEACAEKMRETLLNKLPSERIGHRLGAYRIVQEIGRGGMGSVFLAARADGQFEKQVAIKLLKRGTDTDEIVRRFRAERQILAQLEHQSIARLLDAGTTDDGLPYFVMEYVSGKPITVFARERGLTIEERLELFLKVCAAVERAHRDHVVHRDLKPSNILVTPEGEPKLLDFGIAKLLESGDNSLEATATNQQRFTPSCVSPEQTRGESVTIASDIYALGALLYELLTDRTPHHFSCSRPSSEELMRVVCEGEPLAPSAAVSDYETKRKLRGDLDNIVLLALSKEPARRFPSVAAFADDIKRYLKALPVQARLRIAEKARRFVATSRLKSLGMALALAALVAAGIVVFFGRQPLPPTSSAPLHAIAVLPFESFGGKDQDQLLGLGMADAIIGKLSGLKNLVVLPTAAVSRITASNNSDVIATGRRLNVDAILCGTVQRAGPRMRVSVQLVNVATRQTLWASKLDETFTDLFAMQDAISQEVAHSLTMSLSPEDQKQLSKRNTNDARAYDLYLLGLSSYDQRTKEGLAKAVGYFKKAIEVDPNYALAYALLSDCYFLQGYYMYRPVEETRPEARAAAEQALRIDSSLAEGYLALAMVAPMPDSKGEVERLLRRAIELNPSLALAHQRYAWRLCGAGKIEQALPEMKLAQQLDPLSATHNSALGIMCMFARQFEPALRYSENAAHLNPKEAFIQSNLGNAYLLSGRYEEAVARFQQSTELNPELKDDNLASIALSWVRAGNMQKAQDVMPEVLQAAAQGKVDPYELTLIYAARGDKDEAFKWLEASFKKGGPPPGYVRYDSLLDPIRSDPRFDELLRKYQYWSS
jgi:eukaryotic-like serine/threonine-protein kinase